MLKCSIVEEKVSIPCEDSCLEGLLAYPEGYPPQLAVLLLNPHPHLGGNMDNNVIRHIAKRACEDGAITLRFNYRGIGNSNITLNETQTTLGYYAAIEEKQCYEKMLPDCLAAAQWFAAAVPDLPQTYIGYSLGVFLAAMLATVAPPTALVAVSPPNQRVSMKCFELCHCNKIFIAGDDDFVFDSGSFETEYDKFPEPKVFLSLTGCGHFFRKQEEIAYQALKTYLIKKDGCPS